MAVWSWNVEILSVREWTGEDCWVGLAARADGHGASPGRRTCSCDAIRLNPERVVDCVLQPLLASQIPLRCLDRDMPEKELNLIQLAACQAVTAPFFAL